ncbi:MAG: hypothetical protein NC340_10190 [Ruminococcus flavefaciens]|nr:hypothetical protein [Ruminococcus flavefaciens]MCM1230592.1 hypothetical protein [Ruminococcus flavefaciens]
MKTNFTKRITASLMAVATLGAVSSVAGFAPLSASADDSAFPYAMFAGSSADGAITINANWVNLNGDIASNGTVVTGNGNINGTKYENVGADMLFIGDKLTDTYFASAEPVEFVDIYDGNVNINNPVDADENVSLIGNVNINSAIKAGDDIYISGGVSNANNTVLYSEFGDIVIDSSNVNLNGIVYAPMGNVSITADSINLNNVVIIADTITLTSNNVNANYSSNYANTAGNTSEESRADYVKKYNSMRMDKDINATLDLISEYYTVTPIDAGEYSSLNIMGMFLFDVQQYEVEGYGNLSIMKTDGLQQMSTIVLTPYNKELPLISTDYMYNGEGRINYVEFYEVCADSSDEGYQQVLGELSVLNDRYSGLMSTTPSSGWYDDIRPLGLYKMTDYKSDDETSSMLADSFRITLESSLNLPELSDEQKTAKHTAIQQYSDNLVDMGGISTDMFKMAMGVEKTKDFFNSVFFGTAKF